MNKYNHLSKEELLKIIEKQERELDLKRYGLIWDREREPEQKDKKTFKFEDLEKISKEFWKGSYNEKSGLTLSFVFANIESELHDHCYGFDDYKEQKAKDLLNFASEIRKKEEVQRNNQSLTQQKTDQITNLVDKTLRMQIVLVAANIFEFQPIPQTTSHTPAIGLLVGFLTLIYFGWDKFWAWYESPLTEEWDWDEENDEED